MCVCVCVCVCVCYKIINELNIAWRNLGGEVCVSILMAQRWLLIPNGMWLVICCMDGYMDRWMDTWIDEWIHG